MRIMCMVLLVSLCFALGMRGQQAMIDSLETLLNKSEASKEKVEVLYRLYAAYLYQDLDKAKEYLDQGYELSQAIEHDQGIILAYDKYGGLEMVKANYPLALYYFNKADSLLQQIDWPREQAIIYGNISALYKDMGEHDSSLVWNQKFIDLARSIENEGFEAFGLTLTGDIYHVKGQNDLAAINYLEAVRIYERLGDQTRLADAFRLLGAAQTVAFSYEDAEENLNKAIVIYKELDDQIYLAQALSDLGYLYLLQGETAKSKQYYTEALDLSTQTDDKHGLGLANENLGEIAVLEEDYEGAEEYAQIAIRYHEGIGSPLQIGSSKTLLGDVYNKTGRYVAAVSALEEAEELLKKVDAASALKNVYLKLHESYEGLNLPQKSLQYYLQFASIRDSLYTVEKAVQMEELQLIYDIEKKDQEIALLSKDVAIGKLRRQNLSTALGGIVLLALLIIYMQFLKRQREKKIEEERHLRQAAELERNQLEKEQLERELAAQVLQLCRKNELLSSVQDEVAQMSKQQSSEDKSSLRKLERSIQRNLSSDEDWKQFLSTFEKVHPNFLKQLLTIVDKLSPAEQRLACLFRMNLSSKEIATLLNISDEGVKKARYRLRKKLGLDSDINLQEFLINFQATSIAS